MKRRTFLQRLGFGAAIASAAAPVLKAASGHPAPALPADVTVGMDMGVATGDRAAFVEMPAAPAPETPWYENRLEVLTRRNLIAPCPFCKVVAWPERSESETLHCDHCGEWSDRSRIPVYDCLCDGCSGPRTRQLDISQAPAVTRQVLDSVAKTGVVYRVLREDGRPFARTMNTEYDVMTNQLLHRVEQLQIARVLCAVGLVMNRFKPMHVETYRRPDGNLVVLGWHSLDWLEKAQDEGRAPRTLYHRCYACDLITAVDRIAPSGAPDTSIVCKRCGLA